ncbi:hypothetical protein FHX15_001860 [Rhizobium sp. BK650]|nr:hypothetical protein [Rhizobium sp. BK650]
MRRFGRGTWPLLATDSCSEGHSVNRLAHRRTNYNLGIEFWLTTISSARCLSMERWLQWRVLILFSLNPMSRPTPNDILWDGSDAHFRALTLDIATPSMKAQSNIILRKVGFSAEAAGEPAANVAAKDPQCNDGDE